MMQKSMESFPKYVLFIRGCPYKNKNKSFGGTYKSRGRFEYLGQSIRRCWKCGKFGHYKKDCISKKVDKSKGSNDAPSTKMKDSMEGGDLYLENTSTNSNHDVWLIKLGVSFHMTLHREWFCEYEKYNGGVFSWEITRQPKP
jgi:hypothetical protein